MLILGILEVDHDSTLLCKSLWRTMQKADHFIVLVLYFVVLFCMYILFSDYSNNSNMVITR